MYKLTTLSAAAILAAGVAQSATLTFDEPDFFVSANAVTAFSVDGITGSIAAFTDSALTQATSAIIFNSAVMSGNDDDLVAPFFLTQADKAAGTNGLSAADAGGLLVIAEDGTAFDDPNDRGRGGAIKITFDALVDFTGFRVFDDVGGFIVESNNGETSDPVTLGFNNAYAVVDTDFTNVSSLTFFFDGHSGAIDNLEFSLSDIAAVPVPATLPLLLAGLGAFGFASRRKQRS